MNLTNEIFIEAGQTKSLYLKDLWRYRELFMFLAWRDILVRYKQTVIGVAWSVIKPVMTMIIFTIVFGKLAKLPSDGAPYPILVFAATLPWQFFANSLAESSNSVVNNAQMISKIYFPRLIIPTSAIIVCFVDAFLSGTILAGLMVWYGYLPDWRTVVLPLFMLISFFAALGLGLWFSALNVRYRDIRHIVPFVIQFGLYISPVGFSTSIIPEKWRLYYSLNPMVGVIDGFRWAILGDQFKLYYPGLYISLFVALIFFVSGVWFFRKMEKTFADVI
jgi:lipopolysaccharide transport system permease protein